MVCYIIDDVGVLVAYHVSETKARTRPYLMLCHLFVARGARGRGHAKIMLLMLKEYALSNKVSTIRLGQGIRENAETVDFWLAMCFSIDTVKSTANARILLNDDLNVALRLLRPQSSRGSLFHARLAP